MLFNSFVFAGFFVVVYALYWATRESLRAQNLVLLAASFVFYGWWDWRFLLLLIATSTVHFLVARRLGRLAATPDPVGPRRRLITAVVTMDLVVLGFFKYFNFFADGATRVLALAGLHVDGPLLEIVLPVGISFYTFQTMSYTIEVYRGRMQATDRYLDFMVFVSFFPQLVAGPIERAMSLLPQVLKKRTLTPQAIDAGLLLVLWGYFKKLVIADNVRDIANAIFNDYHHHVGLDLLLGALAFTIQIYCDFSGYTDIARGLAKLLGFELMLNFRLPYFAVSPSDFWRRWHISLSSWLRDYLYVPLGGNRRGEGRTYVNLMLTMVIGGLWHGAAWNFVLWGAYHGVILALFRWLLPTDPVWRAAPLRYAGQVVLMFGFTVVGWVLFRSHSVDQIAWFLTRTSLAASARSGALALALLVYAAPLLGMEIAQLASGNLAVAGLPRDRLRIPLYASLLVGIILFGAGESLEFIYFQF